MVLSGADQFQGLSHERPLLRRARLRYRPVKEIGFTLVRFSEADHLREALLHHIIVDTLGKGVAAFHLLDLAVGVRNMMGVDQLVNCYAQHLRFEVRILGKLVTPYLWQRKDEERCILLWGAFVKRGKGSALNRYR
ncbi:MAG: hypothetical protein WD942_01550 [Dehalococcoidia bacterium]